MRQEPQGRLVGQVRAERGMPAGPEEFEQCIQSREDAGAAFDQIGAQLDRPAHRVTGAEPGRGVHALGMQKWDPGKDFRVQAVGLGVLAVVITQVGRLFGWHQNHGGALPTEPGR